MGVLSLLACVYYLIMLDYTSIFSNLEDLCSSIQELLSTPVEHLCEGYGQDPYNLSSHMPVGDPWPDPVNDPTPGRRCPACLERGDTVWVIPGQCCPACGTPVT